MKLKTMKIVFTSMLFCTATCLLFSQQTYYINVSGNNNNSGLSESNAWRTISYAASSSSPVGPGDIVYIKAGNYGNENVIFKTNGTLQNPIQFIGYENIPGDNPDLNYNYGDGVDETVMPLLDGNDRTNGISITMSNRLYIELSNIQIRNYKIGIYAYQGKQLKVKNIIAMYLGDPNDSYSGRGIAFGSNAEENIIEDCIVYNSCAEGISITGNNQILRNCRVYSDDNSTGSKSATNYYIHVGGNNNLVEYCYAERIGDLGHVGHGIDLKGNCENNIIRHCVSKGMETNGYELRHRGVRNNLIEDCFAINCGFSIRDGASNNIIRNCKTESAQHGAVLFFDTTEDDGAQYAGRNNTFENCIFQNTVNSVINFTSYNVASMANNNAFVNCVFDGGQYFVSADRENSAHTITNSIITNVQDFATGSFPTDLEFEYSYFHNNGFISPIGNSVFTADPKFIDLANDDFHIAVSSPCIDTADPMQAPDIDYDGNQRLYDGKADIGAFEYDGTEACPDPNMLLLTAESDVFIKPPCYGIIMASPDGSCYRIKMANGGSLLTEMVACPE